MAFSGVSRHRPTLRFPARKGYFCAPLAPAQLRAVDLGGWGVSGKGQYPQLFSPAPSKQLKLKE